MISLRIAFKLINKTDLTEKEKRKYKKQATFERIINLPIHLLLLPFYLLGIIFAGLYVVFEKISEGCDIISSIFSEGTQWASNKLYIGITSKEDSQKLVQALKRGNQIK
jgi:hypothetical protein